MPRKIRTTCQAELHRPVHKRAKIACGLTGTPLVDFVSEATDRCARRILKKHHIPVEDDSAVNA